MERIDFGSRSFVLFDAEFVPAAEADGAFATLCAELEWEQREIVLFGKRILQPRLIAWAGELPYSYSGQTLPPRPFPAVLARLRDRVETASGIRFNHVLVNRYRDANDSMGFHSDDEPELGENPVLASLTFGAARRFVVHPKKKNRGVESQTFALGHGALLIMGGAFQHEFRHGVPRERHPVGERINATFRKLLR